VKWACKWPLLHPVEWKNGCNNEWKVGWEITVGVIGKDLSQWLRRKYLDWY